jgi:DNA-binding response OmpR family regulator
MKILLIDDSEGDRTLLTEAFMAVYPEDRLIMAEDGEKALKVLRSEHRDGIEMAILDLNLPKKDGLEILMDIKRDERTRDLSVMILTTSTWPSDHETGLLLEADATFNKPALYTGYIDLVKRIKQVWQQKYGRPPA